MATSISFETVEKECMKALIFSANTKHSQYVIFEKITDKFSDIIGNNPALKNELKYITLAVIRSLSVRNDNIIVEERNNVLYAGYYIDMESSKKLFDEEVNVSNDKNTEDMPNNMSVIEFILSNKLVDFYQNKDYMGNTILHHLVSSNNVDMIINYFDVVKNMIDVKNHEGKIPIDLIKNVSISNIFLKDLIAKNKVHENKISSHYHNICDLNISLDCTNKRISNLKLLMIIEFFVLVMLVFYILNDYGLCI